MIRRNECDVSCLYVTRASFQYIRRIPIILRPKKNLRQLESCQPSSQYEWSVDGWMCCQLQPLVDQYKPIQHETFTIEKFRDLIVTTRSCLGDKKIFFKKEIENIPVSLNKIIKIKCVMNQNLAQPYTDIG